MERDLTQAYLPFCLLLGLSHVGISRLVSRLTSSYDPLDQNAGSGYVMLVEYEILIF